MIDTESQKKLTMLVMEEEEQPIKVSNRFVFINQCPDFNGCISTDSGEKFWYKDGKLHREERPAIECADGRMYWYKNGEHHRVGGPSVIECDGTKMWYEDGKRHREDGPAIEYSNGDKKWFFKGKRYTQQEHYRLVRQLKFKLLLDK